MLGSVATLGVPKRLKEWIKGYPAMLPHLQSGSSANRKDSLQHKRPEPRKGARTVRVMSIRRNVRNYEKDLVKNGASWARKPPPASATGAQSSAVNLTLTGALAESREWERISPKSGKSGDRHLPKYTEAYKKRMNFPSNINPDLGIGTSTPASSSGANSPTTDFVYGLTAINGDKEPKKDFLGVGLGLTEGEDRFKSLTDLKWGEFENLGFGGLGTGGEGDKKLEFDLTEGARNDRAKKRQTLGWDDFSTAGFSRTDGPLSATLQFSQPLTATIERWPQERAEIGKKLKKREKGLPPFGWDTSPVMGGEEVVEEAFVDVFCDLIWGSGWGEGLAGMSGAREQQSKAVEDRECCWALVEFKSLPTSRMQVSPPAKPTDDPRVGSTLVLFEEFVPLEYRQQLLELTTGSRRRLPSLFTPSKKQWKQAPTLNGRPYVVGHVPRSPSYREMEFEGLLRGEGNRETRLLSLSTTVKAPKKDAQDVFGLERVASATPALPGPPNNRPTITTNELQQSFKRASPQPPASEEAHSDSTLQSPSVPKEKRSKFRLPVSPAVTKSKSAGLPPAEYSTVDFETRLRGYSDDSNGSSSIDDLVYGVDGVGGDEDLDDEGKRRRQDRLRELERKKQERREKRMSRDPDDAWVDILVGTHERRMAGQDAEMRPRDRAAIQDPEAASLEVQQALAAVQNRQLSPSDDEDDHLQKKRVLNEHRPYGDDDDDDLDEIETVPRRERPTDPVRDSYASHTDGDSAYQGMEPSSEGQGHTDGDDEDPEPAPEPPKKRLGYFDLHPDRRPASMLDDDPRERAERKYQDSDDEEDAETYATPAAPTPVVTSPAITTPQGHVRPLPVIPPKSSIATPPEVPATDSKNHDSGSSTIPVSQPTPKPLPSKTAALIEMYREKEKGAPAPGASGAQNAPSPQPSSKIPVRTSSKPDLPTPPASTTPPQQQQQQQAKPPSPPALAEPPKIPLEESGRASPARYIHGAPLHNVMEEEEEEDQF